MKENLLQILLEMYLKIFPPGNVSRDRIERIIEACLLIPMYVLTKGDIDRLRNALYTLIK